MHKRLQVSLLMTLWLLVFPFAFAEEVLQLGGTLSLTGKYAELGTMNEKAYRLWERDVNRKGGLLGRQVNVTILDDKSDPVLAKQLYLDLIVKNKVDLVLGPYSS